MALHYVFMIQVPMYLYLFFEELPAGRWKLAPLYDFDCVFLERLSFFRAFVNFAAVALSQDIIEWDLVFAYADGSLVFFVVPHISVGAGAIPDAVGVQGTLVLLLAFRKCSHI